MRWIVVLVLWTGALAACETEPTTPPPGAAPAQDVTAAQAQAKADEPTQAGADEPTCPHLAAQARAAEQGESAGCAGQGKHAGEPCPCAAADQPCKGKGEGCDCAGGCEKGCDHGCGADCTGDCEGKEGCTGDCPNKEGCTGGCKGAAKQATPHAMAPTTGCPYLDSLEAYDVGAPSQASAGVRL